MKSQIIQGNNVDVLKTFPDNHFDSIVTDPPYGIAFLGKDWDSRKASETTSKIAQLHNLPSGMKHTSLADDLEFQYWMRDVFAECLRVLKPGGHLLAFSAARTYHHMAMAAQTAGFEIRDQIMWIYSSGFPKSQDVGKSIDRAAGKKDPNYGSYKCKKQEDGLVDNFGVGSRCKKCHCTFNTEIIQNCKEEPCGMRYTHQTEEGKQWAGWGTQLKPAHEPIVLARKPIKLSIAKNCQAWGVGALHIDATRVPYENEKDVPVPHGGKARQHKDNPGWMSTTGHKIIEDPQINEIGRFPSNVIGEIGEPYQKYFYCPKVSRGERHIGFDLPKEEKDPGLKERGVPGDFFSNNISDYGHNKAQQGNNHPTVKPIELMKYLIKLVTPAGGRVLDPFNGSGSTGCAAVELDYDYTGIELDEKYVTIAEKRIAAWYADTHNADFDRVFEIDKD